MDAEILRQAYQRFQSSQESIEAKQERIEATIDFGLKLNQARLEYKKHDREFSQWLDRNGLQQIHFNDRAGFIRIGRNPEIARQLMQETELTSPRVIGAAVHRRVNRGVNPPSAKPKSRKKIKQIETKTFVRKLLAALRRKRKEANDVDIRRRWKPEAISVAELHGLLSWVQESLEEFVKTGGTSIEDADDAFGGQDHVSNHKNRVIPFDA